MMNDCKYASLSASFNRLHANPTHTGFEKLKKKPPLPKNVQGFIVYMSIPTTKVVKSKISTKTSMVVFCSSYLDKKLSVFNQFDIQMSKYVAQNVRPWILLLIFQNFLYRVSNISEFINSI